MTAEGETMRKDAFQDNAVVITGASSGIGREVAYQLAGQGAWLALALAARGIVAVKNAKVFTMRCASSQMHRQSLDVYQMAVGHIIGRRIAAEGAAAQGHRR
jgi:NADP-dependent 3-hydroxy acid dehydrogenase YdfG